MILRFGLHGSLVHMMNLKFQREFFGWDFLGEMFQPVFEEEGKMIFSLTK